MTDAKTLYPDYTDEKGRFLCGPSNYQPMIDSFGDILVQVDDTDYQGDTSVLYRRGDVYGILIFGWGSCSGCDALQGCNTVADIDDVISSTRDMIKWGTCDEILRHVSDEEARCGEWSWHAKETQEFYKRVKEILSGEVS